MSSDAAPSIQPDWDEARLVSALAQLQEMHIQLRHLRGTIPFMIRPMHTDHASPEDLYASISRSATTAVNDVRNFTKLMQDPQTQEVLTRAKESRAQNSEGIMGWLVTQHEDWLDRPVEDAVADLRLNDTSETPDYTAESMEKENVAIIVDKFRDDHPGIEISQDEAVGQIKVYLPPPARIHFQIQPSAKTQNNGIYEVTCRGASHMHNAMLLAITKRPRADDLPYLLEMLASYSDIKTRTCQKCCKLLDSDAQFPIIRSRKRTKLPDGKYEIRWDSLHTSCV